MLKMLFQELGMDNKYSSLEDLKAAWSELIQDCRSGYNDNIYELDHDLMVREEIQILLNSNSFKKESVFQKFKLEIESLDNDFLKLVEFVSNDSEVPFWKRKFVLRIAGKDYFKSAFEAFGIKGST